METLPITVKEVIANVNIFPELRDKEIARQDKNCISRYIDAGA